MVEEQVDQGTGELGELGEKYRFLFENSGDIIFTLDRRGIITSFNREAEKTTGYDRQDVIGKPFVDVLATEGTKQLEMRRFRKRLDIQQSKPYEAVMKTRSGEQK
jgi:PAS domain S-box-containing protein